MLIYFSPVSWVSFEQRPHKFVRWFHERTGQKVLWIEPYATRLPTWSDLSRFGPGASDDVATVCPNWLELCKPRALPIEPVPWFNKLNRLLWRKLAGVVTNAKSNSRLLVIGKPSELAWQCIKQMPEGLSVVYDCMDDFPSFYSGLSKWSMTRQHKRLVKRSSVVLASSSHLVERCRELGVEPRRAFNGLDRERFKANESSFADRAGSKATFGYIGTMAQWFDWHLIRELALSFPSKKITLIGPVLAKPTVALPANIQLLAPLNHGEALRAMSQFRVGLIPFHLNALTEGVDPIKYYEYRALGLPVLSTNFGEMSNRTQETGCFIANGVEDFLSKASLALSYQQQEDPWHFIEEHSWESRFDTANLL